MADKMFRKTCRICEDTISTETKGGGGLSYTTRGEVGEKNHFICASCILGINLIATGAFFNLCKKYNVKLEEPANESI